MDPLEQSRVHHFPHRQEDAAIPSSHSRQAVWQADGTHDNGLEKLAGYLACS